MGTKPNNHRGKDPTMMEHRIALAFTGMTWEKTRMVDPYIIMRTTLEIWKGRITGHGAFKTIQAEQYGMVRDALNEIFYDHYTCEEVSDTELRLELPTHTLRVFWDPKYGGEVYLHTGTGLPDYALEDLPRAALSLAKHTAKARWEARNK